MPPRKVQLRRVAPLCEFEAGPRWLEERDRTIEVVQRHEYAMRFGPAAHTLVGGLCPREDLHTPAAPVHTRKRRLEARAFQVPGAVARQQHDDAGIAAQARAFLDWHERHRFCAVCGASTDAAQGGIFRKCTTCPAEHFPRTDPVVITVVIDTEHDRCLLGRQASWPAGMFSALAGFIDHGESIEDAVRREVAEESGIDAVNVRYHSSQPWPFPSSLMIGCHADAGSADINYDDWEMDDVRWFTRDEIRDSLALPAAQLGQPGLPDGALSLPGPMAIAHTLISAWVDGSV